MQITAEINTEDIQKIVNNMLEAIVREHVSEAIRENDFLWDYVNEAVSDFAKSDKFKQMIQEVIRDTKPEIVELIKERLFGY